MFDTHFSFGSYHILEINNMKKYCNTQDFSTLPPCVTTTFVNMNTLKWTCYIFTFSNMKNSYEDHANTHNDIF